MAICNIIFFTKKLPVESMRYFYLTQVFHSDYLPGELESGQPLNLVVAIFWS